MRVSPIAASNSPIPNPTHPGSGSSRCILSILEYYPEFLLSPRTPSRGRGNHILGLHQARPSAHRHRRGQRALRRLSWRPFDHNQWDAGTSPGPFPRIIRISCSGGLTRFYHSGRRITYGNCLQRALGLSMHETPPFAARQPCRMRHPPRTHNQISPPQQRIPERVLLLIFQHGMRGRDFLATAQRWFERGEFKRALR